MDLNEYEKELLQLFMILPYRQQIKEIGRIQALLELEDDAIKERNKIVCNKAV